MSTKVLFRRLISIASPPSRPSAPPLTPPTRPTRALPTLHRPLRRHHHPALPSSHLPYHRLHLPHPYLALAPIPRTAATLALPSFHRSSHREHATATESSHLIRSIYVQPSHTLLLDLLHLLDLLVLLARPISLIPRAGSEARYTP